MNRRNFIKGGVGVAALALAPNILADTKVSTKALCTYEVSQRHLEECAQGLIAGPEMTATEVQERMRQFYSENSAPQLLGAESLEDIVDVMLKVALEVVENA